MLMTAGKNKRFCSAQPVRVCSGGRKCGVNLSQTLPQFLPRANFCASHFKLASQGPRRFPAIFSATTKLARKFLRPNFHVCVLKCLLQSSPSHCPRDQLNRGNQYPVPSFRRRSLICCRCCQRCTAGRGGDDEECKKNFGSNESHLAPPGLDLAATRIARRRRRV
jgi:hypothetical protein